jgi:WhiB family redox-sensing transcriptional regulator
MNPLQRRTSDHWFTRAACAGTSTELFFPISEVGGSRMQVGRAKALCARCPVIDECLTMALELSDTEGIWGGLTRTERRGLQRQVSYAPIRA